MNRSRDKKDHLLDTGMAVIFRHGYNGTGVQDIVDAAGVPKGSFYNYFESKEAFAIEGLTRIADAALGHARETLLAAETPPLQRIQQYFETAAACHAEQGYSGGCLIGNLCQEMAGVNAKLRERIDFLMRQNVQLLETCLAEAQRADKLCSERCAHELAEFVFFAWEGALLRMKATGNGEPLQAFLRALPVLLAR